MINIPYDASGDQCDAAQDYQYHDIDNQSHDGDIQYHDGDDHYKIIRTLVVGILVSDGQGL